MKIARVGDRAFGVCYHPSHLVPIPMAGTIISGAETCYADGMKIARVGDIVITDCGHSGTIITGSDKSYAEGSKIARVGDKIAGTFDAIIITGSDKSYSN